MIGRVGASRENDAQFPHSKAEWCGVVAPRSPTTGIAAPRLDIPPRRCLPPVEFCRGTRPSQVRVDCWP